MDSSTDICILEIEIPYSFLLAHSALIFLTLSQNAEKDYVLINTHLVHREHKTTKGS